MNPAPKSRPAASPMPWLASPAARSHKRRCQTLLPPSDAEVSRMVQDFLRRGGAVTEVPPAYTLPTSAAQAA